jgi:hypothetical protein
MIEAPRPFEEIEQDGLVITFEEMRIEALQGIADQPLDHAATVRSTIDIIADEDKGRLSDRLACARILRDQLQQRLKQIKTAVNVAHRIEKLAVWKCGVIQV